MHYVVLMYRPYARNKQKRGEGEGEGEEKERKTTRRVTKGIYINWRSTSHVLQYAIVAISAAAWYDKLGIRVFDPSTVANSVHGRRDYTVWSSARERSLA